MSNFLTMWYDPKTYGIGGKSDLFESKKISPEAVPEPSYYPQLRETIGNRWQDILNRGAEKYTGNFVAPLTDLENQSLKKASEYGSMNAPALYGEGAQEISKTLANEYDPETSAYYNAYRDQRLYENQQQKERFNEDAAGAGRFFHGGRIEGLRKIDESATRDINTTNATLAENERNRRLSVLPQALQFGQAQSQFPLQQAAGLQAVGGLQRTAVDNPELAGMYNEFVRSLGQERSDLSGAYQFTGNPTYAYPQYQTPMALQYLQAIAGTAKAAAPFFV